MADTKECTDCGVQFDARRPYHYCLSCGEDRANAEIERRRTMVMPMHKSNSVFIGSGKQSVDFVKEISRMRRG